MRNLLLVLLALLLPTLTPGAVLNNGILAASDTTGTNATVRSVTITGSTNLWAGTLNATNDITLGGVSITDRLNLWTNDNGTISARSPVVDGGSAFRLASSNTLTSGQIALFANSNSVPLTIGWRGTIYNGIGAESYWGDAPDDALVSIHLESEGYNWNETEILFEAIDGSFGEAFTDVDGSQASYHLVSKVIPEDTHSFANFQLNQPSAGFHNFYIQELTDSTDLTNHFIGMVVDPTNGAALLIKPGNVIRAQLSPSIVDGSTPYLEDTSVAHSSGYLHETRNNGTNKFSVDWEGNTTVAGRITLAATTNQVIFGGTNTAPSGSITTPAKWISVQVQGESTVYRLPLYQ